MLTSVIALCFLLLGAFGISGLTKCRPEEGLPICFAGAILWLFLFYCGGIIHVGFVLLFAAYVLLFFLAAKREHSVFGLCRIMFTPGIEVWLGLAALFVIFLSGNHVQLHDELRLWGAVPKAIHMTGRLQLGNDSAIFSTMQSYPPGLPLIGYFFTAFSKDFSEGALYVAYACTAVAFLVPALSLWDQKQRPLLAAAWLMLLMTPLVFTSHYGDSGLFGGTLFVDPLLGIVAGYTFSAAGRKPFGNGVRLLSFCCGIGLLCLLKSTGIVFALAAVVCAAILARPRKIWCALIPLAVIAATSGTWKGMQLIYQVQELVPLQVHALSDSAVSNILQALVSVNVVAHGVPLGPLLSFAVVFPVLLTLYGIISWMRGEEHAVTAWVTGFGIVVSTAAFIFGYALIYGETLESFPRYMATVLLCLFVVILMDAMPLCCSEKAVEWLSRGTHRFLLTATAVCIVCGVAVFAVWCSVFDLYGDMAEEHSNARMIQEAVNADLAEGETGWVYLVMAGDGVANSHTHHKIFFDMLSDRINIRNGFAKTQVVIPGLENPTETWAEELKNGCDYVYLLSVEKDLLPVFAELSDDPAVEHGLYRVCESDNSYGLSLKRVS